MVNFTLFSPANLSKYTRNLSLFLSCSIEVHPEVAKTPFSVSSRYPRLIGDDFTRNSRRVFRRNKTDKRNSRIDKGMKKGERMISTGLKPEPPRAFSSLVVSLRPLSVPLGPCAANFPIV